VKPRIALVAGVTLLFGLAQTQPCYADVLPSGPSVPESAGFLWVGLAFVIVVSGLSFFLLWRIARRRAASAAAPDAAPVVGDAAPTVAAAPETHDED
jgi:hypothetical protein